eukprot:SAG31_NODE_1463_length_8238_cov_3.389851_8_plen_54_part_00
MLAYLQYLWRYAAEEPSTWPSRRVLAGSSGQRSAWLGGELAKFNTAGVMRSTY